MTMTEHISSVFSLNYSESGNLYSGGGRSQLHVWSEKSQKYTKIKLNDKQVFGESVKLDDSMVDDVKVTDVIVKTGIMEDFSENMEENTENPENTKNPENPENTENPENSETPEKRIKLDSKPCDTGFLTTSSGLILKFKFEPKTQKFTCLEKLDLGLHRHPITLKMLPNGGFCTGTTDGKLILINSSKNGKYMTVQKEITCHQSGVTCIDYRVVLQKCHENGRKRLKKG